MQKITFITGNQHKADYLAKWLGLPIEHMKIDLEEIQSLDLQKIVEHKVRQAYKMIKKPVLVEDVGVRIKALGNLPGPLIKWFLKEIGIKGICELAAKFESQDAEAFMMYALYDGKTLEFFEGRTQGTVAAEPRGANGFGFDPAFIPSGSDKTYAEMTDEEFKPYSIRYKAIEKLRDYLQKL